MEKRKATNGQLFRRIKNAVLHIDKTKDTKEIFFSDKGLRLYVNDNYAVIETGYHRHVFDNFTNNGVSRPYLYIKRLVEIALENNVTNENGYTFNGLLQELNKKEDKSEYNICWFVEKWLVNIFHPLYEIGETEIETFLVYEDYIHTSARNLVLLDKHDDDMTNKQFANAVIANMKEFLANLQENVVIRKKTDEEIVEENINAINEQETNEAMEAQLNAEN